MMIQFLSTIGDETTSHKLLLKIPSIKKHIPWFIKFRLLKVWQFVDEFQVKREQPNLFILIFSSDEQVCFVLNGGP
uniref:DUF4283 domain-containing protein n=1 Tax=Manihot esculenta TaxID=3983 RepID=A0A2C9WFV0_MANES